MPVTVPHARQPAKTASVCYNANDYTNKNTYISNKENINLNNISQKNYCIGILEQKREKELNLMNLD